MTKTGLVSITFRKLSPREVVGLCQEAKLDAIEWGGDSHVPHGEYALAKEIGTITKNAGLVHASYGSYYRTVDSETDGLSFSTVLKTAEALGAPKIRVWAGRQGSASASEEYRKAVTDNLREAAKMAEQAGIGVCLEFHSNTLTDDLGSALRLLKEVDHPNLKTLWQPSIEFSYERQMEALREVKPWLDYIHVFTWTRPEKDVILHPLAEGEAKWKSFFAEVKPPFALLEFVKDNSPEQFLQDAATLKRWLA